MPLLNPHGNQDSAEGDEAVKGASGGRVSNALFSRFLRLAVATVKSSAGRPMPRRGDESWSWPARQSGAQNTAEGKGLGGRTGVALRGYPAGHPGPGGAFPEDTRTDTPSAASPDAGAFLCARPGCAQLPAAAPAHLSQGEGPRYEGRAVCGAACLRVLVDAAIRRAVAQPDLLPEGYQHRMPLGLLMLSRRFITEQQLAVALARQRSAGYGRLGEWLVETGATDEGQVARALAAQWGIPWLQSGQPNTAVLALLPGLLLEACNVVPMRVAAERILYLAIDQKVDPCLNLAVEKMTGVSVEPVAMSGRSFRFAQQQLLAREHSGVRLFGMNSLQELLDSVLAVAAEAGAANIKLARVHEYFWLRVEGRNSAIQVEDCMFACTFIKAQRELADAAAFSSHLEN